VVLILYPSLTPERAALQGCLRPNIEQLRNTRFLALGAERVLDGMERPVKQRAHLVMFVAYELSEELPALGRVRFSRCKRPGRCLQLRRCR